MAKAAAPDSFFPTSIVPPEAVRDYCDRTVQKAADFSRSILTSVSQNVEGNFELATKLIRCTDPAEALSAWKDWANARRDALLADSKGLTAQWLKLCDVDMEMMTNVARRATEQATNVSPLSRAAAGD